MRLFSTITDILSTRNDVSIFYRVIRHLIAGGMGTLFYMVLVAVFVEFIHLHPVPSASLSFLLVVMYTYIINRMWVYDPKRDHRYAIPRFIILEIIALSLNTGVMFVTVETLGLWYIWGLVASTLIIPPTNFILSFFWAFK